MYQANADQDQEQRINRNSESKWFPYCYYSNRINAVSLCSFVLPGLSIWRHRLQISDGVAYNLPNPPILQNDLFLLCHKNQLSEFMTGPSFYKMIFIHCVVLRSRQRISQFCPPYPLQVFGIQQMNREVLRPQPGCGLLAPLVATARSGCRGSNSARLLREAN